jgi:hypothetical protein
MRGVRKQYSTCLENCEDLNPNTVPPKTKQKTNGCEKMTHSKHIGNKPH